MKYVYCFFFLCFFIITIIGFDKDLSSFAFAGGSNCLMDMAETNIWIKLGIWMISSFFFCQYFIKKSKKSLILSLAFLMLWGLSGRTIATFPDGRVSLGWFYFETNRFNLCNGYTDCEKTLYYDTHLKKKPFWCFRLTNENKDVTFFAGPFIFIQTKTILDTVLGNDTKQLKLNRTQ